ncbi:4-hydroxythreonine-4-phosphate dehydrogenase PdxA [Ginsengibacter hankyongi]|uniref:4-hydroxythreonine-4-phosphate dehydrogenase PdxA n=1 Tax=Ginsengibacter hankyongi TaxID=2607284 RepID=A0A5J5ILI2_9BACT|nr:4-hydroxythreonine-4-phosphate dehydrogenase PdxA [Ginsengibacter hankyongi]KAA9039507.1 4-hydroxythreonine-4-phosphate dehydrogenase PdxA [Ginsengibacter hankyongi]
MSIPLENKPVIGFTCGDLNGIGIELILKSLSDNRFLDFCTPVVFASNKAINFYRKSIGDLNFSFASIKDFYKLNARQVNIFNCWEEEVAINPGTLNDTGGQYAIKSLQAATTALKDGKIDALVTAPLHKKNVQSADFSYTGHTPFFKDFFGVNDVLMLLTAENLKIGLVTEHLPVKEIAAHITKENIISKLLILNASLRKDFNIEKPKIAVLALNPHAGDEGLIGTEEEEIIRPAIKEAKQRNLLVVGPFSADAFFARGQYNKFDAVLAMYHDQGLIPFKSLAFGEGVNFTAGLPGIRTSPDHGTAFDIAGKNKADPSSFRAAIFSSIDIINNQKLYEENRKNPLTRMSANVVAGAVDEKISE